MPTRERSVFDCARAWPRAVLQRPSTHIDCAARSNAVDRFFGDVDMGDRTLFRNVFGLSGEWPLWTAPSFDRCLLLALVYPVATIFAIWTASGHVGPAEHALGLSMDLSGWRRAAASASLALACYGAWRGWRFRRASVWATGAWAVGAVGVAGVSAISIGGSRYLPQFSPALALSLLLLPLLALSLALAPVLSPSRLLSLSPWQLLLLAAALVVSPSLLRSP